MQTFAGWIEDHVKQPVAIGLDRLGFTPNKLTLLGLTVVVLAAYWLTTTQNLWQSGLILLGGSLFDMFDGALARYQNRVSRFGAWLDTTCDRFAELIMMVTFIGFFFGTDLEIRICVITFALGIAVPMVKSDADAKTIGVAWDERMIFGYPGRVGILVSGMLLTYLLPFPMVMTYAMGLLIVFNFLVLCYRIAKIYDWARFSKEWEAFVAPNN